MRHRPGTFSIAARNPERDVFGAAVTTGTVAVGATCPYVGENAAVLTQAYTRTEHGRDAVASANAGERIDDACTDLLVEDEHASYRQVHGVGWESEFAFTGDDCTGWCGSAVGTEYTVAGNMLTGEGVLTDMADAYERTDGDMADRLLATLEAGEAAGGDDRGEMSAAVLIHAPEAHLWHNLRVDFADSPVADLQETLAEARQAEADLRSAADDTLDDYPPDLFEFGVKY